MLILLITIVLFAGYAGLIIFYWQSWKRIPDFTAAGHKPVTKISVIIPARNEEKNIGQLLSALTQQSYPRELTEIIIVDDHSEDNTAKIIEQFSQVRCIKLKDDNINSYKKKAIETGIIHSGGDLIVTTDADCIPPQNWLQTISAFKEEKKAVFIAAPVVIQNNSSLLQRFQAIDFLTLQGITGAVVTKKAMSMCNGANMAYDKKVFYEVNGFSGIDNIASGDDILLMHKIMKKYPRDVYYLKSTEAIVTTLPAKTWKEFFNQRIRWASKTKYYEDKNLFRVLLLVYLFNLSFLLLAIAGFWNTCYWFCLAAAWITKTVIEFPFVYTVASFFGKKKLLRYFFFLQPLHIAYTLVAGWLGAFGKYEWKGRKVK
jgi:cellulose synthase/poly-beta-1,6-N-acetylglucosamine synthase-like glycosyltransferase